MTISYATLLRGLASIFVFLASPLLSLAQEIPSLVSNNGANIIRFDFMAPIGANFSYNLFYNRGLVFPLLFSYERRVGSAWSLNAEGLLNGGAPASRRSGVALSARRYLKPNGNLAGLYLSPMVSFRKIVDTEYPFGPSPVVTHAKRVGTGGLVGWQFAISHVPRHWTLDVAAGALYWGRVGSDTVDDITNSYKGPNAQSSRDGWWADFRGGIGYQF